MAINRAELNKIDPKCWLCGTFVKPIKVEYQPLICEVCKPGYRKRKFVFVRSEYAGDWTKPSP